jgi:hypothetical protein
LGLYAPSGVSGVHRGGTVYLNTETLEDGLFEDVAEGQLERRSVRGRLQERVHIRMRRSTILDMLERRIIPLKKRTELL